MLVAGVIDRHLQRQPAAALRRLLHPVGLPRDPQPPAEEHGVHAGADQAARVPREGDTSRCRRSCQRFWLFIYAITSTIYRIFVGIVIILLVAFQIPIARRADGARRRGHLAARAGLQDVQVPRDRARAAPQARPGDAFTLGVRGGGRSCSIGAIPFWVNIDAVGVVEPAEGQGGALRDRGRVRHARSRRKDGQMAQGGRRDPRLPTARCSTPRSSRRRPSSQAIEAEIQRGDGPRSRRSRNIYQIVAEYTRSSGSSCSSERKDRPDDPRADRRRAGRAAAPRLQGPVPPARPGAGDRQRRDKLDVHAWC